MMGIGRQGRQRLSDTGIVEILLVEDNADDARLVLHAFARVPVVDKVHVVTDGIKALEYLSEAGAGASLSQLPSLVLLDMKMPRLSGLEVLERIKADPKLKKLPVIILTSSREPRDIEACYAAGANSYVVKPVDFDEFRRTLVAIATYWTRHNERPFPVEQLALNAG